MIRCCSVYRSRIRRHFHPPIIFLAGDHVFTCEQKSPDGAENMFAKGNLGSAGVPKLQLSRHGAYREGELKPDHEKLIYD